VQRLETNYRTAALNIWRAAEAHRGGTYQAFLRLHRSLRRGSLKGFFDARPLRHHAPDGRARAAFHRLLVRQGQPSHSDAAEVPQDFLKLFQRFPSLNVNGCLSYAKWGSFSSHDSRRIFLARIVPWVLFRLPNQRSIYDGEDDAGDDVVVNEEFSTFQHGLAALCVAFLRRRPELRGELSAAQAAQLESLLRRALRSGKRFEEPLPAPPLPPGQDLQFLFPGLRLDAFARLVAATRPR
jgi:hypothetical protein